MLPDDAEVRRCGREARAQNVFEVFVELDVAERTDRVTGIVFVHEDANRSPQRSRCALEIAHEGAVALDAKAAAVPAVENVKGPPGSRRQHQVFVADGGIEVWRGLFVIAKFGGAPERVEPL